MTLAAACRRYERANAHRFTRRTVAVRRSLHRALCRVLGRVPLAAVGERELERYVRARLRAGLARVSVNNELRALAALRAWALARGLGAGAQPRLLAEVAQPARAWSRAEVERLLSSVHEVAPRLFPLVYVLASTGLRRGEALALRWEHVDLPRRLLRIWPSQGWHPKGRRPREVPISDGAAAVLARLPRVSPHVFPSRKRAAFAYWPARDFDRAARRARLSGGPHRLRHSYASEFLARGGSLSVLAQVLGHSDERTTRLYAHLRPEHLAESRNLVCWNSQEKKGGLAFHVEHAYQSKSSETALTRFGRWLQKKVDAWIGRVEPRKSDRPTGISPNRP